MRLPRIFTDQALSKGLELALESNAARHLVSALRFKAGDKLILFNGEGGEYSAELLAAESKKARVLVGKFSDGLAPSPLAITLGIGLSRGERMDWLVQKAVELGVTEITPLFTERSEVKLKAPRAAKKTRHWQDIAHSACEQSGQNILPTINLPIDLPTFVQNINEASANTQFILDPLAEQTLVTRIRTHRELVPTSVMLMSGPEGGFSPSEIGSAQHQGILSVSLGPRILRTETAPLAALSLLQAQWGDWQ